MTDEPNDAVVTKEDGDKVDDAETKIESETKETNQPKQRSVSFNRDVHVKRFGKPREARGGSSEHQSPAVRKEPFTHLSEKELIAEANKVIEQAGSVTCTADHPPEKFYSLPHRRKHKQEQDKSLGRRNSDDAVDSKTSLGRSTSDVGSKKRNKERTSLSTLFRRAQRTKSPDAPVVVATKPVTTVKRSKSDVSDLKSNTKLNPKPIRKRSGSETEEFLKSLRNKKVPLTPIIESSPREDYFKKTSPLEAYQKQSQLKESLKSDDKTTIVNNNKVNPIEKPPRYKTPDKSVEPKPPIRTKRGKSLEKELSPTITETPKRKTQIKKTILVDEIDSIRDKDSVSTDVKDKIKDSIKKIEKNAYGQKEMIHSSQQPPAKPPLTRGHTVDHIVRILKEDQLSPPPKAHLISPPNNGSNSNQPFSYLKPSVSPDPNLYTRTTSPDRVPSPVNKMNPDRGVVYAHVVKGERGDSSANLVKQTVHKTYSPPKDRYGNISDEDEGLGYEDQRHKFTPTTKYNQFNKLNENEKFDSLGSYKITDSPIRPRFREYKLTSFDDFEPTYSNEYPAIEKQSQKYVDPTIRGRGDGMDSKRRVFVEPEAKVDFNELSHRRELLESRINARRYERDRVNKEENTKTRFVKQIDPIYEAEKKMKATEKYVNETAKYYRHTLERDGYTENSISESYNKYDNDNHTTKYNTEKRSYGRIPNEDSRTIEPNRFVGDMKSYPPEPEYEPPSLELPNKKASLTPDEYKEKKYRTKTRHITSSHDTLQTGHKYNKPKDSWFGKRKGHYASNPEIGQERDEDYVNADYDPKNRESYHNSLRREKQRDKHPVSRYDSDESRKYYRDDMSPRRYEFDNRLVDSGIENDFRKDSSGEIHKGPSRFRRHESDDDVRDTSRLLASERRHTEDNYPSEQIYANGEYTARMEAYPRQEYVPRERSVDDGSHFDPRIDRFNKSPSRHNEKISAKPPKAAKKLSGLEKMKQLFSRDSSKKSKKEKESVQKPRTRVLKSPEHLARRDSDYRRYRDPEPSDDDLRRREYDPKGSDTEKRYRSSDPDSDIERKYIPDHKEEFTKTYREEDHRRVNHESREEHRRVNHESREDHRRVNHESREERQRTLKKEPRRFIESSDRESPKTPSDVEVMSKSRDREMARKSRSMTADSLDSPALAERYRERRRLATPSPTPSPPRRAHPPPAPTSSGNWFKSLDRLARKRTNVKKPKEIATHTEEESIIRKTTKQPSSSPAKNLRFFGDTDLDSDGSKRGPKPFKHSTLRKTVSNSSNGLDEIDNKQLNSKSNSLTNLRESPKHFYKRNLQNISEIQSNSENESHVGRKISLKPPISPYDRRSRSHSSSKAVKEKRHGSRSELRHDERGSSSELKGSKQELSRDMKHRRRTPANNSGESSTEGESSHQSQRSVVFLHATTVGEIPDPGRIGKNRSRDDVSSLNSSQVHVKTVAKSFSLFAPWTPRHYPGHHDVNYSQKTRRSKSKESSRPSKEPTLQKNKSYSQTTLTKKPQNHRLTSSSQTLYRKPEKIHPESRSTLTRSKNAKSQSNEVLHRDERDRVSRSLSMPKDKKAGWFKISTNRNKKAEINSRVR